MSFVTLTSAEGQCFRVDKSIAQQSHTVSRLLEIGNEDLFDLITAANYLEIEEILDIGCKKVADKFKNKSPADIRKTFGIVDDLSNEEDEQIRMESAYFDCAFPAALNDCDEIEMVFRLLDLPNEIISIVFRKLNIVDRFRARVSKRLNLLEQQGKYHIKQLNLISGNYSTCSPEKLVIAMCNFDENVCFKVNKERYIALLQKISRNTSVDNLTMSTFHLDHTELMSYVNSISTRELTITNLGTGQLDVDKDSLNEWTRERESLYLPRTKLTGVGLVSLYDDMANSKIPLRRFRMDAKSPTLFYFLRIIGITLVDNKFVSTRTDVRIIVEVCGLIGSKYFFLIGDNMVITTDRSIVQYDEGKLWIERCEDNRSLMGLPGYKQDILFNSEPLNVVFNYPNILNSSSYYSYLTIHILD
ncbi:hypothetical protein PRIPAC_84133 [Pristionchus pacificus]|uniref:F-box domain-containing protein n=1 Tax=Pristionchus pacificus TaxID=54126 RepID=A0A2A6BRT6_PRIPA|nr:hypothetical protein PRIPAC_84133 [Pristionchus pacificus]|eukprot:PDM68588.1 hypothetical protein PRIPAC_46890 [Pristionchus pacificus]